MNWRRGLGFVAIFALVASAGAQDGMLGRGSKGGGKSSGSSSSGSSQSGGKSAPAPKQSDSGSSRGSVRSPSPGVPNQVQQGGRILPGIDPAKRPASRSGRVNYGTINNEVRRQDRPVYGSAPSRFDLERMRDQVRREDDARVRYERRGSGWNLRFGYTHYNRSWRDDHFGYPYYVFNPVTTSCVVSPWYYYSYLPGYINLTRVIHYGTPPGAFAGIPYDWQRPYRRSSRYRDDDYRRDDYRRNYGDLDYAIDDLVTAFEEGDRRMLDRLIPRYGTITIGVDGSVMYGIGADDYYDMMADAVETSYTLDYRIIDVKIAGSEAEIVARHDYRDPWGERITVFHRYRLVMENDRIFIRFFGTNTSPYW